MHTPAADRPNYSTTPEFVIRPVLTSDSGDLFSFYGGLSGESLHVRSLGYTRGLSGPVARSLCTLDHMRDEGFVARATEHGEDRILGHVCLAHVGPRQLELGICVADGYQGLGIGRRLFEAAVSWATAHRFESIVASCYATNGRVLALLASAPFGARIAPADAGVVDVTIPLEANGAPRAAGTCAGRL